MTRLVNFGLGEICDRLSILNLKVLHGEAKGIDVAHFRNERSALMVKLMARQAGKWFEHYGELAAVNAMLWQAEDALRRVREAKGDTLDLPIALVQAGEVAFEIQALNDQRAQLVAAINALVGDIVGEKL